MKSIVFTSIILAAASTGCATARAGGPDCANPVGAWVNQLKSTLTVASASPTTGALAGTYRSPSGTPGQSFPMIGWTNQTPAVPGRDNVILLTFTVRWGEIGSITAWSGVCREENGVPTLTALWHLARSNSQFPWDHVLAGNDVFTPSRD
jgi:hypothetical protein